MKIEEEKNQVTITVNTKIYPLEVIFSSSYIFLDHAYILLDEAKTGIIVITLKGKEKMDKKQLEKFGGEFYNALLNDSLRNQISKTNQKIREYIVGSALIGAVGENEDEAIKSQESKEKSEEVIEEWKGDDLGIAVPWEEKVKKTKTS